MKYLISFISIKKKKKLESIFSFFNPYSRSNDNSRTIKKSKLYKIKKETKKSIIENDRIIVGVYVRVYGYNKGKTVLTIFNNYYMLI